MAAKVADFFEMASIFEFMRVEAKKIRKMVLGASARQKKYCRFRVCVDFFFNSNLLPPYLLRSQGDNTYLPNAHTCYNYRQKI